MDWRNRSYYLCDITFENEYYIRRMLNNICHVKFSSPIGHLKDINNNNHDYLSKYIPFYVNTFFSVNKLRENETEMLLSKSGNWIKLDRS